MRVLLVVSLSVLSACPGGDSSDDPVPVLDARFVTQDDVRMAFAAIELPYLLSFGGPDPHATSGCPVVTRTDGGYLLRGGCVDQFGRSFDGELEIAEQQRPTGGTYHFTYRAFSSSSPTTSVVIDGEIESQQRASDCGFPGPAPLRTDDLRVSISGDALETFGGFFPGVGRTTHLQFSRYEYAWDLRCEPATLTAHGIIGIDGLGTFSVEAMRQESQLCSREADEGAVLLVGANRVDLDHQGATLCDDCVGYQIDDGSAGQLCW